MREKTTSSKQGDRFERRDVVVHRTVESGHGSLSVSVVEAVAEAKNVAPVDIQQPLADVVDPDALNRLFERTDGDGHVTFELADHEVTVHATGEILVRARSDGSDR